jgi:predicted lipid-binding transport protein (Tim44 family)
MGLGDKFKDLKKQAQDSVVEHRDQIQDAVGVVGMAVDRKTKGRHTQRIAKFGQKASVAVDKLGSDEEPGQAPTAPQPAPSASAKSSATPTEPAAHEPAASVADEPKQQS